MISEIAKKFSKKVTVSDILCGDCEDARKWEEVGGCEDVGCNTAAQILQQAIDEATAELKAERNTAIKEIGRIGKELGTTQAENERLKNLLETRGICVDCGSTRFCCECECAGD